MKKEIRILAIVFIIVIFLIVACSNPTESNNLNLGDGNEGNSAGESNDDGVEGNDTATLNAVMSELEGFVEYKEMGSKELAVAKNGDTIFVSGEIATGEDGRVRLTFSDGSILRLGKNSQFVFEEVINENGKETTKIRLDWGSLFVILSGGSLDVDTDSGVASVRGSYMEVRIDPVTGQIIITCLEGDCSVETEGGGVNITAGQSATIDRSDLPPEIGEMTPEDILRWLQNNPEATAVIVDVTATVDAWKNMTQSADSTETSVPDEPTVTPTATLSSPQATLSSDYVCTSGPGGSGEYNVVGTVFAGQAVNVVGQGSGYWVIEFPGSPGVLCWVPKSGVVANSAAGFVRNIDAPPMNTPIPKPTRAEDTPVPTPVDPSATPCPYYYNGECYSGG